jgi:hypothetical protein
LLISALLLFSLGRDLQIYEGKEVSLLKSVFAVSITGASAEISAPPPPPKENKAPKRLVVAAHFREDTSWLNELSQYWPVLLLGPGGLPENKGNEAMAYLTYIIENYDNLPESVAFVHGHDSSWHTGGSQIQMLLSIGCWELIPYTSITSFERLSKSINVKGFVFCGRKGGTHVS